MLSRKAMSSRQVEYFDVTTEILNLVDTINVTQELVDTENLNSVEQHKIAAASWAQAIDARGPVDATRRSIVLTSLANDIAAICAGVAPGQEVDEWGDVYELVEQERVDVKPYVAALRYRATRARNDGAAQSSVQFKNALFNVAHKERALSLLTSIKRKLEEKAVNPEVKVDSAGFKAQIKALLDGNDPVVKEPLHYALSLPIKPVLGRVTYGNVCAAIREIESINVR